MCVSRVAGSRPDHRFANMTIAKRRAGHAPGIIGAALLAAMVTLLPLQGAASPLVDALDRAALPARNPGRAVLNSVARAGDRLVAVGERGVIALSDDNGRNWRQAQVPVSVTLTAVHFNSSRVGWVIGHSGVVLRTDDAGEHWARRLDGKSAAQLVLEAARREPRNEKALAMAAQLVEDGPDKPFLDIHFVSDTHGYIVGAYGLLLRTDDGGANWRAWTMHVDNPQGLSFNAMAGGSAGLYIVGEQGAVWRANHDGSHFERLDTAYRGSFFGVAVSDDGQVVAGGLLGNVYRSSDRGASWGKVDLDTRASVATIAADKGGDLIVASQRGELFRRRAGSQDFARMTDTVPMALTGFIQAADGSLVGVGFRGAAQLKARTSP